MLVEELKNLIMADNVQSPDPEAVTHEWSLTITYKELK